MRYADDFVILCRTHAEAERALAVVQCWVEKHELTLHPQKTCLVDVREEGFDFLGYYFVGMDHHISKKSLESLKSTIRKKTRRNNGHSIKTGFNDKCCARGGW